MPMETVLSLICLVMNVSIICDNKYYYCTIDCTFFLDEIPIILIFIQIKLTLELKICFTSLVINTFLIIIIKRQKC